MDERHVHQRPDAHSDTIPLRNMSNYEGSRLLQQQPYVALPHPLQQQPYVALPPAASARVS